MATVRPFRGLRYNPDSIQGSYLDVTAPPYDVIDINQQEALYKQSPHNCIRLILGRQYDGDGPGDNRYTRAAKQLEKWTEEGVLQTESLPAFYIYEQTFDLKDGGAAESKVVKRRGVLSAVEVEHFGKGEIYAHEETFAGPKEDRLNLMRAARANLSPIFGLVPDEESEITNLLAEVCDNQKPFVEFTDPTNTVNKMWVSEDADYNEKLSNACKGKGVFIADGHHRYETTCAYRDERRKGNGNGNGKIDGRPGYEFAMMMCVPMSDPGLFILPTHRLIHAISNFSNDDFLAKADEYFDITETTEADLKALAADTTAGTGTPVRIGVVFQDGSLRELKVKDSVAETMKEITTGRSDAWRDLDVSILHEILLKKVLQLDEEKVLRKEGVTYVKDAVESIQKVAGGDKFSLGFLLRPTHIDQVREISLGGEKMPQKSTYFYPKLLSGMVLRKL